MARAVVNTSPLLYLYRIGGLEWLAQLFTEVLVPSAVVQELQEGQRRGYEVPDPNRYRWLRIIDPQAIPSEWLTLDLGRGELAVMALALEDTSYIVVLDDARARELAEAAGLTVWGTLKVILEAKSQGFTEEVKPHIDRLAESGMWMSEEIRKRILELAGESN